MEMPIAPALFGCATFAAFLQKTVEPTSNVPYLRRRFLPGR
jgi:hypothetical protein